MLFKQYYAFDKYWSFHYCDVYSRWKLTMYAILREPFFCFSLLHVHCHCDNLPRRHMRVIITMMTTRWHVRQFAYNYHWSKTVVIIIIIITPVISWCATNWCLVLVTRNQDQVWRWCCGWLYCTLLPHFSNLLTVQNQFELSFARFDLECPCLGDNQWEQSFRLHQTNHEGGEQECLQNTSQSKSSKFGDFYCESKLTAKAINPSLSSLEGII